MPCVCRDVFLWEAKACSCHLLSEESIVFRYVLCSPSACVFILICCNSRHQDLQYSSCVLVGPFEWIVSYNLGLLHLATGQFASAFHHFSSSINIKSDFAHTYMYLAVALARLDDVENASAAYEKALELDDDMIFRLNYGVPL